MMTRTNYVPLLATGLIFLMSKYSVLVAQPLSLSGGLEGQAQLEPGQDTVRKIDYEATDNQDSEENSPVLQKRGIIINNGMFGSSMITFGGRVDISNSFGGLTIRAHTNNQQRISISNNKVTVGDKVVCDDINKKLDKATYQKSSDGTLWYTNMKVGEPMTQAEIDAFEKEWAQYEKEREERWRQRDAERRKRDEERERRYRERDEERERARQQREAERRQREEERERQRKERDEERERERNGEAEEKGNARRGRRRAKAASRRTKAVTSTSGGARPAKAVNMHNPFRDDFMEGFMDGFMD